MLARTPKRPSGHLDRGAAPPPLDVHRRTAGHEPGAQGPKNMNCNTDPRPRDGETLGAWIDRVICREEPGRYGRAERVVVAGAARARERRQLVQLAGAGRVYAHASAGWCPVLIQKARRMRHAIRKARLA